MYTNVVQHCNCRSQDNFSTLNITLMVCKTTEMLQNRPNLCFGWPLILVSTSFGIENKHEKIPTHNIQSKQSFFSQCLVNDTPNFFLIFLNFLFTYHEINLPLNGCLQQAKKGRV